MILIVDNYDSFTYNLVHYCQELGASARVMRNDAVMPDAILAMSDVKGVILSPGPCSPNESGVTLAAIRPLEGKLPILGVCLGHQAIAQAYGAEIIRVPPVHGKTSVITHNGTGALRSLPSPMTVARYHSLAVNFAGLPDCLEIAAFTEDGVIMAINHRQFPTFGVQFHPESVVSEYGRDVIANFLRYTT